MPLCRLLNTPENVRSVLVNEGGTWRVETTSDFVSGFGFRAIPSPQGQDGKFLGVAGNSYQLLNAPSGGGGGGTGGAQGDLIDAVPTQDGYGIAFTRRSGAAFHIDINANYRAIGETLFSRNVGAQVAPPQAAFPISGGNEETEGTGTATGRLARLTTTNRFNAQLGSADVRVSGVVEWEAGTFVGFAPTAELDIRVATADGTGTSIGKLTLHNNEIQPFSFEVSQEAAAAAVSDGNGFYAVNFVATGMTRGGAAPHGTLTFSDIQTSIEGFGYEPVEHIAETTATDIIDPVRQLAQTNQTDIMANTNAISELQRRTFYTPRQDVIDFHALIAGEHLDGDITYRDPFRRLFRATPAGGGAIGLGLDDDNIVYNANIGGRRGITGLGAEADKVIYCELSNPTEHALYIRVGGGSQAFYGIHTDSNNNRWHTFYDPDENVGLDAGRRFAEDGTGNVAYLQGDRVGYSAEVRPGGNSLWIIPVIFRAAGGNPIQCNDIEFNSANAVSHYDPDAILIHTGDFVEDLWVAYHSGASIRHSQIGYADFTKLDGLGLRIEGTGRDRIAITGEVDFTAGIYDNGERIWAGYPTTTLAAYDATALAKIAAVSAGGNSGLWVIPAQMSVGNGIPDAAFTDMTGGDAPSSSGGERLLLAGSVCQVVSGTDIRLLTTPRLPIKNLSFNTTTRNLTATRQDGTTFNVNIPGGTSSGGGGGGLTPEQINGLIDARVADFAEQGSVATIPQARIENLSADLGLRITQTQGDNRYRLQSVALTAADIPNHSAAKLTSGLLNESRIPASITRDSEVSEVLDGVTITGRRLTFTRLDNQNPVAIDIPNPTAAQIPALPQDRITGLPAALDAKQNTLPAGTDGQLLGRVGGALAFVDAPSGSGGLPAFAAAGADANKILAANAAGNAAVWQALGDALTPIAIVGGNSGVARLDDEVMPQSLPLPSGFTAANLSAAGAVLNGVFNDIGEIVTMAPLDVATLPDEKPAAGTRLSRGDGYWLDVDGFAEWRVWKDENTIKVDRLIDDADSLSYFTSLTIQIPLSKWLELAAASGGGTTLPALAGDGGDKNKLVAVNAAGDGYEYKILSASDIGTGILSNERIGDNSLAETKFTQAVRDKLNATGGGITQSQADERYWRSAFLIPRENIAGLADALNLKADATALADKQDKLPDGTADQVLTWSGGAWTAADATGGGGSGTNSYLIRAWLRVPKSVQSVSSSALTSAGVWNNSAAAPAFTTKPGTSTNGGVVFDISDLPAGAATDDSFNYHRFQRVFTVGESGVAASSVEISWAVESYPAHAKTYLISAYLRIGAGDIPLESALTTAGVWSDANKNFTTKPEENILDGVVYDDKDLPPVASRGSQYDFWEYQRYWFDGETSGTADEWSLIGKVDQDPASGGGTAPTADNLAAILGVPRPGSQAKINR